MSYLGLVVIFFLAGYVQFNLLVNRGALAFVMWIGVFSAAIYFYRWFGAGAFLLNALIGSKLAFNSIQRPQ
jgi:hypothetical protein